MTTAIVRDIGARLSDRLAESLGRSRYERWFGDVKLDLKEGGLTVTAPNRFAADFIARNYQSALSEALADQTGEQLPITIQADRVPARPMPRAAAPAPARTTSRFGHTRYSLTDLVIGDFNRMAITMAKRLVDHPEIDMNPLVIHGGCGVGKTHLLQGLCRRFAAAQPIRRWRYLTAEQFTNDYIAAVRTRKLTQFRQSLRKLDLLVIDDMQFLANKTGTQTEFLHTFDALELADSKVVLACDVHPKQMGEFSEQLLSRFVSGMVTEIQSPDHTMRMKLLHTLGARRGLIFHEKVLPTLAQRCGGSVRDIEGQLNLIEALADDDAHTQHSGERRIIGHALMDRLLGASGKMRPARPVRFSTIFEQVCDHLSVERATVLTSRRQKLIVLARSITAYLARKMTAMSYPEIAKALKRPNHTTIITACQRVAHQIEADQEVHLPSCQSHLPLRTVIEDIQRRIVQASV